MIERKTNWTIIKNFIIFVLANTDKMLSKNFKSCEQNNGC